MALPRKHKHSKTTLRQDASDVEEVALNEEHIYCSKRGVALPRKHKHSKTTLRQDASDVEEVALNEASPATRGSITDSMSLEDSDTDYFSQSVTVGITEEALEQPDKAEPTQIILF